MPKSKEFFQGKRDYFYIVHSPCIILNLFSRQEIHCKEPIISINHKIGLCGINFELGKLSETIFNCISNDIIENTSLILCKPLTGRTHQIRVHLQSLGFPIIGDTLYNNPIWDKYKSLKENNNSLLNPVIWTESELIQIAQELLTEILTTEVVENISLTQEKFDSLYAPKEQLILPYWFEPECEDCQRQWLRSHKEPCIPLIVPIDCPTHIPVMNLHAFKYSSKEWEYSVEWPDWALNVKKD